MIDISNKHEWINCFIKNNQEMLLDLAYFTLEEQPKDNFKWLSFVEHGKKAHIPWPHRPIRTLKLHMIIQLFRF